MRTEAEKVARDAPCGGGSKLGCGKLIPDVGPFVDVGEAAWHGECLPPAAPSKEELSKELRDRLRAGTPHAKRRPAKRRTPRKAAA